MPPQKGGGTEAATAQAERGRGGGEGERGREGETSNMDRLRGDSGGRRRPKGGGILVRGEVVGDWVVRDVGERTGSSGRGMSETERYDKRMRS